MFLRSHKTTILAALVSLTSVTIAEAQTSTPQGPRPHVPTGYLLIEEEQWDMLSDEPSRHLSRARDAFLIMDARTAAAGIHSAGGRRSFSLSCDTSDGSRNYTSQVTMDINECRVRESLAVRTVK